MSYDHHGPDGMDPSLPKSLLPYDKWFDEAQRDVMLKTLEYVSSKGLPGEHHFYITFRTQDEGVRIPPHLKARYPEEMTIVLQHQFDNLTVDRNHNLLSVGLSFGGVHSILSIPFHSLLTFADPYLQIMLHFNPHLIEKTKEDSVPQDPAEIHNFIAKEDITCSVDSKNLAEKPHQEAEIVSLSAFRKKTPPTD